MKKQSLLVNFIGVALILIFCLFLYDMGQEIIKKMGETWTGTHTSMVLLAFLALVSAVGLHFSGGINVSSKGQGQGQGYKMIEGQATQQPYGFLPGPAEQEAAPAQYNDTFFGETVDL